MFENPRRGRQAINFTTNVSKILDLKSSSEQIFFRKLSLGAPEVMVQASTMRRPKSRETVVYQIVYDDEPKPVDCEGSWDTLYHVTSDGEEAVFLESNLWIGLKIHFQ